MASWSRRRVALLTGGLSRIKPIILVLIFLAPAAGLATLIASLEMPHVLLRDFYGFWAAGRLTIAQANLYDPALYELVQLPAGWDPAVDGAPALFTYFYPPWIGFLFAPFGALDYEVARGWWLVVNLVSLILSGFFLSDAFKWPRQTLLSVWTVLATFPFMVMSLAIGQGSILELVIVTMSVRFALRKQFSFAGIALALALTRPQVAWGMVFLLSLWLLSKRQWKGLAALGGTLFMLVALSFATWPTWPFQLYQGIGLQGLSAPDRPWVNPTIYAVIASTLGAGTWPTYIVWGLLASAAILFSVWLTIRPSASVWYPILLGLALAFVAGPYVRPYDLTVLLIPLLLLLRTVAESRKKTWAVVVAVLVLLYGQEVALYLLGAVDYQVTFLWLLALPLVALWLLSRRPNRFAPLTTSPKVIESAP